MGLFRGLLPMLFRGLLPRLLRKLLRGLFLVRLVGLFDLLKRLSRCSGCNESDELPPFTPSFAFAFAFASGEMGNSNSDPVSDPTRG